MHKVSKAINSEMIKQEFDYAFVGKVDKVVFIDSNPDDNTKSAIVYFDSYYCNYRECYSFGFSEIMERQFDDEKAYGYRPDYLPASEYDDEVWELFPHYVKTSSFIR